MDKRKYLPDDDVQEIILPEDSSSPDAWIQPEMLRRCTSKHKTMNGELGAAALESDMN